MSERPPHSGSFWTTLPGILTGLAAVIGALATAWVAFRPAVDAPPRDHPARQAAPASQAATSAARRTFRISALDYSNGPDVSPASRTSAPHAFGNILMNRDPPDNSRPNWAEWRIQGGTGSVWLLRVEYAAGEPRPVQVLVNGRVVVPSALNATTGCWDSQCQQWRDVGTIALEPGENVLRLDRPEGVFPHIRMLEFVPVE
ncbi:hypothetical protein DFH01_00065 [Falsiroseomonas bella]|uniref:CBM6 domain-containing protein n=1 Tax=Falsiroseomonas bella TaxID=2184016 RepID=A0A317FJH7_9PROT|nr:hypothetical protein [Falsiroseomonas bella]PWS37756.1 hypothetical protein DFH01_00065 [Falsiroseomonas bella]